MTEKESQQNISNDPDPIWKWWRGEGGWIGGKGKESQKNVSSEGDPVWEWWKGEGTWLGKEPTKGFSFLTNGNIGGAVGLALAGLLLVKSQDWAETWKRYGRNNFPLTKGGWATLRKELSKARAGIGGIGKG